MRVSVAAWSMAVAGAIASAQTPSGDRVRVLGNTMARQTVTRVAPVYPAVALEKGIGGEVILYTAVSRGGSVEQVAVVEGPAALQQAAIDAVRQWKFSPWLVNGTPVEVDTTVEVDFRPDASGSAAPLRTVPAGAAAISGTTPLAPRPAVAAQVPARNNAPSGSIDWVAARPGTSLSVALPAAGTPTVGSAATATGASGLQPSAAVVRTVPQSPPSTGSTGAKAVAAMPSAVVAPMPLSGVVGPHGGATEWHLIKKVAPEYPPQAVEDGVEGVVLVTAVVKTDGRLRDLRAVSGPVQLRDAALDAASQYVYEPTIRGHELTEAKTQVPIAFTLSGPATVAPEVMAGRILNSYTPPYPPEALKAGIDGVVVLHVLIGRQGQVKDVRVVSGREMLRATAVDAVKQWQYLPYKRAGVDVEVETDVQVQFTVLKQ